MKKQLCLVAVGVLAVLATAACASPDKKLPSGSDKFPTSTSSAGGVVETTAPAKFDSVKGQLEDTPSSASSCDVVREALLTGTPTEVTASMTALVADKAAPAIAREYADYYLHRDAAQPSLREMDVSLIRTACS